MRRFLLFFYIYTNSIDSKHFLSWDEIKEMDRNGMIIADHSLSHPYFKKISLDQIKTEVTESKTSDPVNGLRRADLGVDSGRILQTINEKSEGEENE